MPLLRRKQESDSKVISARLQVDLAVLKMTEILNKVQAQANKAKEELDGRRTG